MDGQVIAPALGAGPHADFVEGLFGRVPAEDLASYAPAALRKIAASAREFLHRPRPTSGEAAIRLRNFVGASDHPARDLTVLEILSDDRPYLLDSTLAELHSQGLTPLLVAHPVFDVLRGADGALIRILGAGEARAPSAGSAQKSAPKQGVARSRRESLTHIHLDRIDSDALHEQLCRSLAAVSADVAVATDDQAAMRASLDALIESYGTIRLPIPESEAREALTFLEWLRAGHFLPLGMRAHGLDQRRHPIVGMAALGLLRDPQVEVVRLGRSFVETAPQIAAFLEEPQALIITKASARSRVHRRVHLDYIEVKLAAPDGALAGVLRIVGLFAPSAYTAPAREVPVLRRKVEAVLARAGFDPRSHAGRGLIAVLETYPRDDLFQIDIERLTRFALTISDLADRPRLRVLARVDRFRRFVSLLVYVPKDRYDSRVRTRIGAYLADAYGGRLSASYVDMPDGSLVRLHIIVGIAQARLAEREPAELEAGIAALVRTWGDALRSALADAHSRVGARALYTRYAEAFSAAYREHFSPEIAVSDIAILERLRDTAPRAADLDRRDTDPESQVRLKVFSRGAALALSDRVPILENLGFRVIDERTYRVAGGDGERIWLHDMLLERATGGAVDFTALEHPLEEALIAIGEGRAESDGYNRLVLEAALPWREAALLRALGRYLRQLRIRYGQDYLAATLSRHPAIARGVVALFRARFDPGLAEDREAAQRAVREDLEGRLAEVTSLDEDRILRRFVNLVEAAIRTNLYQAGPDGGPRETISFKFACAAVAGMPLPKPFFEIFVYSPGVEGVHLRYGYVARGGLRWSDRPEDFRTEILGLVKAQQVKNAVIVPVGAKGGFYPKRLPPASDRAAWLAEGTESYRVFIRALLELTDNIVDGQIIPPADTVRQDPDDAYLVVAADKGTATFSDIANALSIEKGHWLGDAFASGGSQGYDHKGMGITARGAWEAVRRHFREMDVDVQADPVTVAGVGDMSGDVFGNGMLLSRSLRLVAAFDHRDIFLDPDPDPATSFAERERLFGLGRSSWGDYDKGLISRGGGVFSRSLKSIPLSPEIRTVLDLDRAEASPAEVMQAILRAPVDLLWFGGIGTYIRAGAETDADAGDRANDAVRITGAELRAKVVGEGANLGLTQRGRIEAARAGVRLNTDAIDNSAGVNTSDVEVNIKIALMTPERDGRLGAEDRNRLLATMTDEVARLVLRNNMLQALALSLARRRGPGETGFALRTMQALEAEGRLDRAVEHLPDNAAIAERLRRGEGLTRPEYAVLLAYAKLSLYDALLESPVIDDAYFERELQDYFPAALHEKFPDAVSGHPLRREIVATVLSNVIVNRGGLSLVTRLADETGAEAAGIARAYALTRDAFGLIDLNAAIDGLAGRVPGAVQLDLYAAVQDLLTGHVTWFLREIDVSEGIAAVVSRYRDGVDALLRALPEMLDHEALATVEARRTELADFGLPPTSARRLAALRMLNAAPDIIRVAETRGRPVTEIAATHFALESALRFDDLVAAARQAPVADTFDRIALERAVAGITRAHRALTAEAAGELGSGAKAVEDWIVGKGPEMARIRDAISGIVDSDCTISKATVAASLLDDLVRRR